ncbi:MULTISPECIES: amidase domain-containing protein [Bacillus]|uniref:amidase domain-containing protein n=1 Tax=Bacillus TaxID=1386 RepID=UPI00119FE56B|nr:MULTISPECIES: amidase domain-containing protein [Bacillus]TYO49449.1 hypothetical protein FXF70_18930 [Bacillus sp. Y3]
MRNKVLFSIFSMILLVLFVPTLVSALEPSEEYPVDHYTVQEGQDEVLKYLSDKGLKYNIGSPKYVEFLDSVSTLNLSSYNQRLMNAYAGIYLMKQEDYFFSSDNGFDKDKDKEQFFKLDKEYLQKTFKEVRESNEQKNVELEKEIQDSELKNKIVGQAKATASSSFDRAKAKKYIDNNWNKTSNSRFGYFGGSGGDCTNYVSQVIYAGGKKMNYTGKSGLSQFSSNTKGWYSSVYRSPTGNWSTILYSTSWVRVVDFYAYWSRGSKVYTGLSASQVSKKVSTGDVIQAYNKDNGGWFHTVVVYDVNKKGETRYSGHSRAHKYAHLSKEFKGKGYKFRVIKM